MGTILPQWAAYHHRRNGGGIPYDLLNVNGIHIEEEPSDVNRTPDPENCLLPNEGNA